MTIKGLGAFVKAHHEKTIHHISYGELDRFTQRPTVDMGLEIYRRKAGAQPEVVRRCGRIDEPEIRRLWIHNFLDYLQFLIIDHQMHVHCVFDGGAPPEKFETQTERKSQRRKMVDRLAELDNEKTAVVVDMSDPVSILESITTDGERERLLGQIVTITHEDLYLIKCLLAYVGIPFYQADGIEGEKLCAELCLRGTADAVWTSDMDALVCGARCLISPIPKSPQLRVIILDELLQSMGFQQHSSFADMCIAMGNDFNHYKNVPKVGPVKLHKWFAKEQKTLEEFCTTHHEHAPNLRVERCRELFLAQLESDHLKPIFFDPTSPLILNGKNVAVDESVAAVTCREALQRAGLDMRRIVTLRLHNNILSK
jgi:5'-3' exonuclease